MISGDSESAASQTAERDHFIPVRKIDILDAMIAQGLPGGSAGVEQFRTLCRMLGAIYHFSYFEQLERLRADYFYFNPDISPHARCDSATLHRFYADLRTALQTVLDAANFVEIPPEEIERAHNTHAMIRVRTKCPIDDYREIRFFRRGHRVEAFPVKEWWGLRQRTIVCDVYDDIVMFVAMKSESNMSPRARKTLRRTGLRPGSVLLKYFRNIASADLNALYPDVRVIMSRVDQLVLGIPALAGGIPIVLNLIPTLTILFLLAGFYFGISGAVDENDVKKALAGLSGFAALGGFMLQQWIKYQRQSLKYQKAITDNVYFRNVNNNAGMFDYLIGAAEEQECKEACLAYYFLLTADAPATQETLDRSIETWLREKFGVETEFEVSDALSKLRGLGLLDGGAHALAVLPLDRAIARLDQVWDGFFDISTLLVPPARPGAAG